MFRSKRYLIILMTLIIVIHLLSCDGNEPAETTQKTFAACEHEPSDWIVDREPSFEDTGSAHIECIICGFVLEFKSTPKLSLSKDELYEKLKLSLVKVLVDNDKAQDGFDAQGSGFFIDENCTFITNAHVVENAYSVSIIDHTGTEYKADQLIAYEYHDGSFYNDYAILRVSEYPNSFPVEFAGDANPGDTAYTIGFPGGVDSPFISQGEIINMSYHDCILSNCYTAPGSSGGILVNAQGKVLGITTLKIYDENSKYLQYSVRYLMFMDSLEKNTDNKITPLEYFHPEEMAN